MKLTDQQIAAIRELVAASYLGIRTLEEDLVDHLCCSVEKKLESGQDFQLALEKSLEELAPSGLKKIEHDTDWLLNNNAAYMRKLMYLIGLMSSMSMSMGFMFRIFAWRGGLELMNYGFFAFAILFVPMVAYRYFREHALKSGIDKLRVVLGVGSGLITAGGILFKYGHLPGADELLLIGALIFSFVFLPIHFFALYKKASVA